MMCLFAFTVWRPERNSREVWGQAEGLDNKHERNNEWPDDKPECNIGRSECKQRARKRAIQKAAAQRSWARRSPTEKLSLSMYRHMLYAKKII